MGSKYTQSDMYIGNVVQYTRLAKKNPLESVRGILPDELAKCLKICLGNIVASDFFIATFDWAKRELKRCNATEAEAVSRIAVKALRAQAFKGVDPDEFELMRIAVMDVIIDLNDASQFPSCEKLLNDIEESSVSGLSDKHVSEAAATVFVDALAAAYWDPIIKLVDVLIEVVGKKKKQEYQEAVRVWASDVDEAKANLADALKGVRRAESLYSDLKDDLRKLEAELRKTQSDDELKRQDEALLAEAKRAETDLPEAELALAEDQGKKEVYELKLSQQRQELAGLGMFAFDKKKTLRHEIEDLESKVKEIGNSIESQKGTIRSLKKKAEQRWELERRLAAYPESRAHELESKVRDAKHEVDWAYRQVKEAEGAKSKSEHQLRARREERPEESNYSSEAVKRTLQWRPTMNLVSRIAPAGGASGGISLIQSGGYRRGSGSTWRDRRPLFFDSNPVHISAQTSTGFSRSRYTASVGYNINIDNPDMTHRMDVDIEGPASVFDKANAFLADVSNAFLWCNTSGKFSFLKDFNCIMLPFTSIDTRLYVPEMDVDELAAAIGLLGAFNKECPQLKIDGIIEMVRSYAGIRNTYHVTSAAGDPTITAEQKVEGLR